MNKYSFWLLLCFCFVTVSGCRDLNSIGDSSFSPEGEPIDTVDFHNLKDPSMVKLYVETSGSMNGFFRNGISTKFKETVWSVFTGLSPFTDGNVYLLTNSGQIGKKVDVYSFRQGMNSGGFISNASTQVPDMLKSIIKNLDVTKGEVAVLVSDMKYSPTGQNNMSSLLSQYQTDIRNLRGSNSDVAIAFVCAVSEFAQNGQIIESRSPYYFIILGDSENVGQIRNYISTWVESVGDCYVESGDLGVNYKTPKYEILNLNNAFKHDLYPMTTLYGYDRSVSDTCSFVLRIDLTAYPWIAIDKELLEKCLNIKSKYGAQVSYIIEDIKDEHHYQKQFKRKAYVDYRIRAYEFPLDDDVLEWHFNNNPIDESHSVEFLNMIMAQSEGDLSGSFSFDKFIRGCYNGCLNESSKEPVKIFVSSSENE